MRKLLVLSIVVLAAGSGVATYAAQASPKSATHSEAVKIQWKRYYHALGYYKVIWQQATRTVYSPNVKIRRKWQGAVKFLKTRQINALNEIHRLTAPPSLVPAGYPPHYQAWLCIHSYEGSWTDSGAPFWGGLQMDYDFQATYGAKLLQSKGTADHWTPLEQMWVAERAFGSGRGFYPWPNTARRCGLL